MRFNLSTHSKLSGYADWTVRSTEGGGYVAYKKLMAETVELSKSSVLRLASLPEVSQETLDMLEAAGVS